jgi:hypothetical protein
MNLFPHGIHNLGPVRRRFGTLVTKFRHIYPAFGIFPETNPCRALKKPRCFDKAVMRAWSANGFLRARVALPSPRLCLLGSFCARQMRQP